MAAIALPKVGASSGRSTLGQHQITRLGAHRHGTEEGAGGRDPHIGEQRDDGEGGNVATELEPQEHRGNVG